MPSDQTKDSPSNGAEKLLLHGFRIGGYRSFFTPQNFAPLSRITVLAGQNNSGKSNVFQALERWLPWLGKPGEPDLPKDLDVPIVPGNGQEPRFALGLAWRPGVDLEESLRDAVGYQQRNDNLSEVIKRIAASGALKDGRDPSLLWVNYVSDGTRLRRDPDTVAVLVSETSPDHGLLHNLSHSNVSSSSPDVHISSIIDRWQPTTTVPVVIVVPAIRSIEDPEKFDPATVFLSGQIDPTGKGLPSILQALHAPAAERHRADTAKFKRINRFVQLVLEEPTAELTVPYNRGTVHVSIGERVLPLARLGQGISQVIHLATLATWYDRHLLCLEEPETNLHPVHLRRLVTYLMEETTNQYLINSHSPHLLDNPATTVIKLTHTLDAGTEVEVVVSKKERASLARHLGYRPSDLLQSNAIIWVEGPSDRTYVNYWLSALDDELKEGVHYSVLFYGGALRSHITGHQIDETEVLVDDLISLPRINHSMVMIADSDRSDDDDDIGSAKTRLDKAFTDSGCFSWITSTREIENYIPAVTFQRAVEAAHPSLAGKLTLTDAPFSDRFYFATGPNKLITQVSKTDTADEVVAAGIADLDFLDLSSRIWELANYLRAANDLPPHKRSH